MSSQQIFIEDQFQFMVDDLSSPYKELGQNQTDMNAYISQFFTFDQSSSSCYPHENDIFAPKSQKRNKPEQTGISKFDSNQHQAQSFSEEQTVKQEGKDLKAKPKRQRPSDHNICKKFHSIANKCLRKLGLYKLIQPEFKKIHKRNYFILVLIIADKAHKLKEFKQIYSQKIEGEAQKYKGILKNESHNSPEYNHNRQMLDSIESSLSAINLYENGFLHESVLKLFNVEKLKRQGWIDQAFLQVSQFGERIQMEIERVLTRF